MQGLTISQTSTTPIAGRKPTVQKAVEHIEQQIRDEVAWQSQPSEDGLLLRKNAESLFKPQSGAEAKGTVLLYHGYTAAPWQYTELADKLHAEGFHVYAPRLPGHGLAEADGKPSVKEIPTTGELAEWDQFADEKFADAAALGAPVYTVGLSGGGNVAINTAKRHEDVAGVVVMAPFLGGDGFKGALFPVINFLDVITFGLLGKAIDGIKRKETSPADDPTPQTKGTWGQALTMYRVGARVDGIEQPLQVIGTAKDILSGRKAQENFLEDSAPGGEDGWYHFPAAEGVQHAMLSRKENPNTRSVETVEAIVTDFLVSGKLAQRPPA